MVQMKNNSGFPRKISILTPVYNEEAGLQNYARRVSDVLFSNKRYIFTILFIDDGSSDSSWKVIKEICANDEHFQALRLSRNYGSHVALSAGFAQADGDAVATLAADLQDPPETILKFLKKNEEGAQIVWGKRRTRQDKGWKILTSKLFFWLLHNFAMPKGSKFTTGSFLLADRLAVNAFLKFTEHNRITFALFAWTGFEQSVVEYDRDQRNTGTSGWTFSQMIKTMYDAFIAFSRMPIRVITYLGVFLFFIAILLSVFLLTSWLIGETAVNTGWTSIMLMLSALFGIQFLLMGIMGEYLSRIHTEAARRPLYFISDKRGFKNP